MRVVMLTALLLMFSPAADAWFGLPDDSCVFTREDAIDCLAKHVDTDHNGWISAQELDTARRRYAGPVLKMATFVLGALHFDVSTETTFKNCDFDHDGHLTADDFRKSVKTCLPDQRGMCILKSVCDRAAANYKSWF